MYKRLVSFILIFVLVLSCLPSVAAATSDEDASLKANVSGEMFSVSDNQNEGAEQNNEDVNLAEQGASEELGAEEYIESENEISPASVYDDYPLSDYRILWVSGKTINANGQEETVQEPCSVNVQGANRNTTYVTQHRFLRTEDIVVAVYKVGYGATKGYQSMGPDYSSTTLRQVTLTQNSSGGATSFRVETKLYSIDSDISSIKITLTARPKNTTSTEWQWTRNLTIQLYDDRAEGPTTPHFVFDSSNPNQYILTGLDDTMEYCAESYRSWTPCTGEDIPFSIPTEDTNYLVRYRAMSGNRESQAVTLKLPARRSRPVVSINWGSESFVNLSSKNMEYYFNGSGYMPVTDEMIAAGITPFADAVEDPKGVNFQVRYIATDSQPASSATIFILYPRAAAPDINTLSLDTNTYILRGVSSSIQYKGPEDASWKNISGTSINLSSYAQAGKEVEIQLRTAGTTNKTCVSKPTIITLPPLAAAPSTLHLDYENEKITGFLPNTTYQYRIGTGAWRTISLKNLEYSITSLITSTDRQLSIRVAATTSSQLSSAWTVTLPGRPTTPTCSLVYNDSSYVGQAVLTDMSVGMEYQKSGDTYWTQYTGGKIVFPLPSKSTTYYVRVAATNHSFASTKKTLTLAAPGAAPSSSLNMTTELISIGSTMEYKINSSGYTKLPQGTTSLSVTEYINQLSGSETCTVTVRYAATATKPASKEKIITLVARRTAPTTVQYDAGTQMISGATTSMQYRVQGTETWKSVAKASFSVASMLESGSRVVLEFRYKPTTALVASDIALIRCY